MASARLEAPAVGEHGPAPRSSHHRCAELDQAGRLEGIDRQQDEAQTRARAWADRQREAHSRHEAAEGVALDRQEESIDAGEAASRRRADEIEREAAEAQRAADVLAGARKNIEHRG
jgi:hypothetical protein